VEKSKASQAFILGKSYKNAEEIYYYLTGAYTADLNNLDVECPGTIRDNNHCIVKYGYITFIVPGNYVRFILQNIMLIFYQSNSGYPERIVCLASKDNDKGNKICKSMTNKSVSDLNVYGSMVGYSF
jgi:hypothetical protein